MVLKTKNSMSHQLQKQTFPIYTTMINVIYVIAKMEEWQFRHFPIKINKIKKFHNHS